MPTAIETVPEHLRTDFDIFDESMARSVNRVQEILAETAKIRRWCTPASTAASSCPPLSTPRSCMSEASIRGRSGRIFDAWVREVAAAAA